MCVHVHMVQYCILRVAGYRLLYIYCTVLLLELLEQQQAQNDKGPE